MPPAPAEQLYDIFDPLLCHIDLYIQNKQVVQGVGLIIFTFTGSTAYAAAASMVNPNVPAITITHICSHSLSFSAFVAPAGVEIKITVSQEALNVAWISFNGCNRRRLDKNGA